MARNADSSASAGLYTESAGLLSQYKSYGSTKHMSTSARTLLSDEQRNMDSEGVSVISSAKHGHNDKSLPNTLANAETGDALIVRSCNDEANDDDDEQVKGLVVTPRRKKVLLVAMAIMDMAGGLLFGMIGPFFPTVVSDGTVVHDNGK